MYEKVMRQEWDYERRWMRQESEKLNWYKWRNHSDVEGASWVTILDSNNERETMILLVLFI